MASRSVGQSVGQSAGRRSFSQSVGGRSFRQSRRNHSLCFSLNQTLILKNGLGLIFIQQLPRKYHRRAKSKHDIVPLMTSKSCNNNKNHNSNNIYLSCQKKTNERQKWQKERKTLSNEKKGVRKGAASYFKVGPHRDIRSGDNALVCTHSTHTAGKVLELVDT